MYRYSYICIDIAIHVYKSYISHTSCAKVHELPWGHWQMWIGNNRDGTLSVFLTTYIYRESNHGEKNYIFEKYFWLTSFSIHWYLILNAFFQKFLSDFFQVLSHADIGWDGWMSFDCYISAYVKFDQIECWSMDICVVEKTDISM